MQVSPSIEPVLDTATVIAQTISSANSQISQAETTTAQVLVSSQSITNLTDTITATISQAQNSIIQAKSAVDTATAYVSQVDSATTTVNNINTNISILNIAVDSQTTVVADKTQVVESATAVVNANTTSGLNMSIYSNPGSSASPTMGGNLVYTTRDTNGIYEVWGGGGPNIPGGTTTTTETFTGNRLNTNIGITVNETSVSTTNNSGVYIGSIGFPGPGQDPSLSFYTPTATTTITMPVNTVSAGFDIFAKNGNTTGLITYTDGTTEAYVLQHNVSSEYTNYVHREIFTAPAGKMISTVTIPTDWDYFAIDNVSATQQSTTTVNDDFQVRWQGLWTPQTTGTQYITAQADDGVRLYLDGQLVIDDWFDKGGGGSTADIQTTAGIAKTFDMWYYENGGGAVVYLQRYTGTGWENIPSSEFSTTSATSQQIQTLQTAQTNLQVAQATLAILESDLDEAEQDLVQAQSNLQVAQNNLSSALTAVGTAVSNMNTNVNTAQSLVAQTLAAEEAERQRIAELTRQAEIARQAAIAAENARLAAQQAYEAEQARIKAEAEAKAEADRIAAEQAEAERIAAEEAAKAEAEAIAKAEEEAKAEAERLAKEEADAKAKAEEEAKQAEQDAIDKAIEDALDGKELTEEQKDLVVEALLEDSDGEAVSAEDIKEAGLDYKDLPADTPVDVRTDSNGNAVIITAEVAANLELISNPTELLSTAFSDPGAALAALGSLGADMSPEEREKAEDMVVATVVATGAAINAIGMASAPSAPTGGGPSGGSSGGTNSGGSRRNERW